MPPASRSDRCPACKRSAARCACALLPRARPRTRVVVIQHALDRTVCSNTGSLVERVLAGSVLIPYGDRRRPLDLAPLAEPGRRFRVLFPLENAVPIGPPSDGDGPEAEGGAGLIVLDATWSQARKMAQRIAALRGLPFVRLPDGLVPRHALRIAPARGQLGTAEAVAAALRALGDDEAADALLRALAEVARTVLGERGKLPTRRRRRPHEPRRPHT
jgi:DTW domain-containing protein